MTTAKKKMTSDVELRMIMSKMADSQLIVAEAIKNINHNTTTVADCQTAIRDNIVAHAATTSIEHRDIVSTVEKYWKLILAMLTLIGALVGIKLVFPTV